MADKYQREIQIDDAILQGMVIKKGELVESGRALAREMEEIAKQHERVNGEMTKVMGDVNALKRKIVKRVEKLAKKQLGEFEIPVTTEIKDGKLVLLATDALEEFKDSFRDFDKWNEPVPRKKKLEGKS